MAQGNHFPITLAQSTRIERYTMITNIVILAIIPSVTNNGSISVEINDSKNGLPRITRAPYYYFVEYELTRESR